MKSPRLVELKRDILQLFTHVDTARLGMADVTFLQTIIKSLINPPALSRQMPTTADYQRAFDLVQKAPRKNPGQTKHQDLPIGPAEISLVMQALETMPEANVNAHMRKQMLTVLRSMANGHIDQWRALSKSTETFNIRQYAFLKEALLRAKEVDSFRMEQAPIKRSRKRFWDGGVSV